ncbi:DEAD/DEAH box helicase [Haliangium sp.]|uniref:DEAD/DEAH box helicase n=1 Tax=Haliangium sp. TaxID=2663208 RepID=UPI003D139197
MLSIPSSEAGADSAGAVAVPCMRIYCEPLMVDRGSGFAADYREVDAPVIQLSFDYDGVRVHSGDPLDRVFCSSRSGTSWVARDRQVEARAQYLLESFGAVELACLGDYATAPGSGADYLIHPGADVHALCSFSAYAVPQLRRMGWKVEIDDGYPYRVVGGEVPWYADIEPEDGADWFELELGVEVEGRRINLLPALLDLIEHSPGLEQLDRLNRRFGRCVALPTGDGRYLPLPPERLETLIRVLLELYQGRQDPAVLRFHATAAAALAGLDQAVEGELRWCGDTDICRRGEALALRAGRAPVAPPQGLQATLRPYQETGLAWLQGLRAHDAGGVLADDMGLGKTLQTIAHLLAEKESGRMDRPALVVAPTSLVGNWARELGRFAPSMRVVAMHGGRRHARWDGLSRCDVVITTYGLLARDRERWAEHEFHFLILDEAQAIKNPRSRAHRAVKAVSARHCLCLTGTPVENSLDELWSLFDVLMPGLLGPAEHFRTMFQQPIERQGNQARLDALRGRVAPYILRRMKEEVAPELPPKTEIVTPVSLRGPQRELYESIRLAAHADVRNAIRQKGMAGSTIAILDALMKLRQVCCDPRLVSVPSARAVERSAKRERFFELLTTQLGEGRRVLVFSQFISMLALLSEGLLARGVGHVALTGATANRQRVVDRFEAGEVDVFLISLKAGGTGLNLTSADTVIHYDPWWNPAAQDQATDRAYRIGQTKPVFVHNLIVAGSVEERMLALQRRKRHLADTILGRGSGAPLDERDLDALFAPLG